jgi:hypothetical protein
MIQEIEIGILIELEEGLRFFGIENVNDLLTQGAKVISIEAGGAIMDRTRTENGYVEVTLSGFSIKVKLEYDNSSNISSNSLNFIQ